MADPEAARFKSGDRVQKVSGYRYPGVVEAVFAAINGEPRYVVRADHPEFEGMLHIFSETQLKLRETLEIDLDALEADVGKAEHLGLAALFPAATARSLIAAARERDALRAERDEAKRDCEHASKSFNLADASLRSQIDALRALLVRAGEALGPFANIATTLVDTGASVAIGLRDGHFIEARALASDIAKATQTEESGL